jgi:hypothetical protein
MRNLPAHPSTVNPKTLVQSKKIGRGKTAAARTRMVFEIEPLRPLCAGLPSRRSQLPARLRSAGCIFSTSGAQEMQKKQSSVSPLRSRLVDQGSSLLKDRRSSLLKFPLVFVRATVCRNRSGRSERRRPAARADARASRCHFFAGGCAGDENFSRRGGFSAIAGAGELACPRESSTELAGG